MTDVEFREHENFSKSFDAFVEKYRDAQKGLEDFKKIANKHFHPVTPQQIIGPGKLHVISRLETCTVWKVEMSVKGLRKNQSPRVWFAIQGGTLVFLCIGTHIDNYDNKRLENLAVSRASDFF
jgi:hypothetical protein